MSVSDPVQESQVAPNTPLVVWASLAGILLSSLIIKRPKPGPKLENHPMCGITTGGQEECYYACSIRQVPFSFDTQFVRNPACLKDCGEQMHPCVSSLIRDVMSKGVCNNYDEEFEGVNINNSCVVPPYGIVNGTCSPMTQELLTQPECVRAIEEQPEYIYRSMTRLIRNSCSRNTNDIINDIPTGFRPECSYDCDIDLTVPIGELIVTNPACLLDCGESIHPCVSSLVGDVISKGMCTNTQEFEGVDISNDCEYDSEGDIANGTCSDMTETLVTQPECRRAVRSEPYYISDTINYLIRQSCSRVVFIKYVDNIYARPECSNDCAIDLTVPIDELLVSVTNPACLEDCGENIHPCVSSLVGDVISKGMCNNTQGFEGVDINDDCEYDSEGDIAKGTCSAMTGALVTQPGCASAVIDSRLPYYIVDTINYLIEQSCSRDVFIKYVDNIIGPRPECSNDCDIDLTDPPFIVTNPACLLDCGESIHPCVSSLVGDVISKGMCTNTQGFEGVDISNDCEYDEGGITKGTCSDMTETLVTQPECASAVTFPLAYYIYDTIDSLIRKSCSGAVYEMFFSNLFNQDTSHHRAGVTRFRNQTKLAGNMRKNKGMLRKTKLNSRLAPAEIVDNRDNLPYRTVLNYEHTRHRYPWVCSLRATGTSFQHFCAVTLLSIPPKPTVVVGPAHCTYLCKKNKKTLVPSCCCAEEGLAESCSDDTNTCGDSPSVFLMTPADATIICGEWETGPVPSSLSGEEYNVVLPIKEIVRHPNFTTDRGGGPLQGNDIVVFKTEDTNLQQHRRIRPACLPLEKRKSALGIHTGWSRPPPYHIIERFAPGYLKYYRDFSKQWHYKMDIMDKCRDQQEDSFGNPLSSPTNSYYPPATVCAKDFSRSSCFSQGDSGSPLMVREESRPQRFYAEGFLSFVKGCDQFYFVSAFSNSSWQLGQYSDNPAVYTKLSCHLPWIAKEYEMKFDAGDVEEECLQGVGDPQDGANATCKASDTSFFALSRQRECIFPFFYNGVKYTECIIITLFEWVYLTRCPVRNLTITIDGISSFTTKDAIFAEERQILPFSESYSGYCPTNPADPTSPLDPDLDNCDYRERRAPFGACNNNCRGVRAFGVIGGGAVLAFAGGAAGLGVLGPVAGAGALGVLGIAGSGVMCMGPFFCKLGSGQCCLVVISLVGGLVCPDTC